MQSDTIIEFKKQLDYMEKKIGEKDHALDALSRNMKEKDDLVYEIKQKQKVVRKEVRKEKIDKFKIPLLFTFEKS